MDMILKIFLMAVKLNKCHHRCLFQQLNEVCTSLTYQWYSRLHLNVASFYLFSSAVRNALLMWASGLHGYTVDPIWTKLEMTRSLSTTPPWPVQNRYKSHSVTLVTIGNMSEIMLWPLNGLKLDSPDLRVENVE
jgi:hypothetical protein